MENNSEIIINKVLFPHKTLKASSCFARGLIIFLEKLPFLWQNKFTLSPSPILEINSFQFYHAFHLCHCTFLFQNNFSSFYITALWRLLDHSSSRLTAPLLVQRVWTVSVIKASTFIQVLSFSTQSLWLCFLMLVLIKVLTKEIHQISASKD